MVWPINPLQHMALLQSVSVMILGLKQILDYSVNIRIIVLK